MTFSTINVDGQIALEELDDRRQEFPGTGKYPFLIGGADELDRIQEAAEFDERSLEEIVEASMSVDLEKWVAGRRSEAAEYGFAEEDTLGDWSEEMTEKGGVSLHFDTLSGRIHSEVYIGIAEISEPWHLPAVLKYGAWNDCPLPEIHCAFYRKWQQEFGAQIAGMSGDVVECIVNNPPLDQATAVKLAWEQYWYCADIVEQGCESVSDLAATLLNSDYWYFWWD